MVRVTVDWHGYNARRCSRPWIGKITAWPAGKRPEIEWGTYCGNADAGGTTDLMAAPGDIIRYGQRDSRGNGTVNEWATVQADGSLRDITPAEARNLYCIGDAQ